MLLEDVSLSKEGPAVTAATNAPTSSNSGSGKPKTPEEYEALRWVTCAVCTLC